MIFQLDTYGAYSGPQQLKYSPYTVAFHVNILIVVYMFQTSQMKIHVKQVGNIGEH